MGFDIEYPRVTDSQVAQVTEFLKRISPETAKLIDIETVLAWIGRLRSLGENREDLPPSWVTWIDAISTASLVVVDSITAAVMANANHLHGKRVETAIFARCALWYELPERARRIFGTQE